jgi:hypothetical protein
MAKPLKPDLDDATIQIARRMLGTPPKPHEEMKIGRLKRPKPSKTRAKDKESRQLPATNLQNPRDHR